jgi:hypothetical protein
MDFLEEGGLRGGNPFFSEKEGGPPREKPASGEARLLIDLLNYMVNRHGRDALPGSLPGGLPFFLKKEIWFPPPLTPQTSKAFLGTPNPPPKEKQWPRWMCCGVAKVGSRKKRTNEAGN